MVTTRYTASAPCTLGVGVRLARDDAPPATTPRTSPRRLCTMGGRCDAPSLDVGSVVAEPDLSNTISVPALAASIETSIASWWPVTSSLRRPQQVRLTGWSRRPVAIPAESASRITGTGVPWREGPRAPALLFARQRRRGAGDCLLDAPVDDTVVPVLTRAPGRDGNTPTPRRSIHAEHGRGQRRSTATVCRRQRRTRPVLGAGDAFRPRSAPFCGRRRDARGVTPRRASQGSTRTPRQNAT